MECLIPPKRSMKVLYTCKHFPGRYRSYREWVFFLNTVCMWKLCQLPLAVHLWHVTQACFCWFHLLTIAATGPISILISFVASRICYCVICFYLLDVTSPQKIIIFDRLCNEIHCCWNVSYSLAVKTRLVYDNLIGISLLSEQSTNHNFFFINKMKI